MTNIQQIITDLEQQKAAIETALASLRGLASGAPERRGPGRPPGTRGPGRPPKKHPGISEEGRQRIADAQRERWAAKKAAAEQKARKKTGGRKHGAAKKSTSEKVSVRQKE